MSKGKQFSCCLPCLFSSELLPEGAVRSWDRSPHMNEGNQNSSSSGIPYSGDLIYSNLTLKPTIMGHISITPASLLTVIAGTTLILYAVE